MSDSSQSPAPLLTFMVPTCNRRDTALPTIRSLLALPCEDMEVLVQDCSDTPEFGEYLKEHLPDPRLRYHYSPPPLSMVENWNLGMPLATGEFICILGDDDGVNPEIVRAACWAREQKLDAVAPTHCAVFWWPNFPRKEFAGSLRVYPFSGKIDFPDIQRVTVFGSHGFGQRYLGLPRAYQGLVRRECLVRLREQTGMYFAGLAPDFYIANALTATIRRYSVVDYPLVIVGASGNSNTGRSNNRSHSNRSAISLHLREFKNVSWDDLLPPFCNGGTIMGEGMITAFRKTGREDLLRNINLPLLYATCLMHELPHALTVSAHLLRALHSQRKNRLTGFLKFVAYFAARVFQRAGLGMRQQIQAWIGKQPIAARNVSDTEAASVALTQHLRAGGRQFNTRLDETGI